MAYCTATDVYLRTGTSLGTITEANITSMIAESDAEIVSYLTAKGYTAPTSSNALKSASVYLTMVMIIDRLSIELSRPESLTLVGDITFSVDPSEAKRFTAAAYSAMDSYIATVNTSNTYICITPNADDVYLDMRR